MRLPPELRYTICELIYNTHLGSLVNLASCSKHSYTISTPLLYHTFKVCMANPAQLVQVVEHYANRLGRDNAFGRVRRLEISGPAPHHDPVPRPPSTWEYNYDSEVSILGTDERYNNFWHRRPLEYVVESAYRTDGDWQPLADLIKKLPALADLVFQRFDQVPPCLLQALHKYRPSCRLHVNPFSLYSLSAEPAIADPHELMLATSPCLYSISIGVGTANPGIYPETYHLAGAVMRMVSGLAPNLMKVYLYREPGDDQQIDEQALLSSFRPHWVDLPIAKMPLQKNGSLSHLDLYHSCSILPRFLRGWSKHTDFTRLQSLRLGGWIKPDTVNDLANNYEFPCLTTLDLSLSRMSDPRYYELVTQFVHRQSGLRVLEMDWVYCISLNRVLGRNLRALTLRPFWPRKVCLTVNDIDQIRQRCPFIENLSLAMHRSEGNTKEVALYRALGTIPKLQHLCLNFVQPSLPTNDFPSSRYCLRKGLINCAVDERLALEIFETISEMKKGDDCIPLQTLKLQQSCNPNIKHSWPMGNSVASMSKRACLYSLARTWQVERSVRDDMPPIARVPDLEKYQSIVDLNVRNAGSGFHRSHVMEAFRYIWPEGDRFSWQYNWHSFPLLR